MMSDYFNVRRRSREARVERAVDVKDALLLNEYQRIFKYFFSIVELNRTSITTEVARDVDAKKTLFESAKKSISRDPKKALGEMRLIYDDIVSMLDLLSFKRSKEAGLLFIYSIDEKRLLENAGLVKVFRVRKRYYPGTEGEGQIAIGERDPVPVRFKTYEEYEAELERVATDILKSSDRFWPDYDGAFRAAKMYVGDYSREDIEKTNK